MAQGLGEILVQQGVIDEGQLATATEHQQSSGGTLAKSLIELGLATEIDLVRALAARLGMPYAEVSGGAVDPTAAQMVSRALAEELEALPVRFGDGDELVVAVADPKNTRAKEKIEAETGLAVVLALSARRQLHDAIAHLTMDDAGPLQVAEAPSRAATEPMAQPGGRITMAEERPTIDLDELLVALVERGGSDLHLTSGIPPTIRVHGDLTPLDEYPMVTPDELRKMLYSIMTQKQREKFENELELDMSYAVPGMARYRVNVFMQRDSVGSVMRVIPFEIKPLDDLGVPSQVSNFAYMPRGFVLVTGPTGSGKSTTLASMIDLINTNRPVHIMTVEDPIEFLHRHKRSVVNQREVGTDTYSFAAALKHVLRQDPDVILVGEMRDLETIQIALTAAETGHLVFGTLHTQDAPQTIDRVIDVFPPHQQEQIRVQLAGALQGVVCQQLLKTSDGAGRTVACEVMVATPGVRNLIREGKTHQIYSAIQAGAKHGMVAMDQSLATLVKRGTVTYDEAAENCSNMNEFNRLVGRGTS
ncbi:MAG: PilT/PilU family type 4a pilus ATPase [Actinobacteria bacterium]|nr:PilT/PilU family type 4a pilus ATPase [Actinomycetota bacterium]